MLLRRRVLCTILVLWCFSWGITTAVPLFDGNETFCGSRLSNALRLVCKTFHTLFSSEVKGSSSSSSRSGVAEECCYVPCSYETLSSYCSVPRNMTDEVKAMKYDPNDPSASYQLRLKLEDQKPSATTTKEEVEPDDAEDDYQAAEPEIFYIETDRGPWIRSSRPSTTLYVTRSSP